MFGLILANGVQKAFLNKVLTNFGPNAKIQNGNLSLKKVDGGFFDIITDVGSVGNTKGKRLEFLRLNFIFILCSSPSWFCF